ncbi:SCO family protein [Idiomarina xiamenensis]|uniref:Thioredoxin domain-containing protein n=1 Tax=Idiomarina xiamenensis 10-D-4 TaxID=740709 RepID=K2K4F3_9GAMM|nr:SCO family protein [Idiomarina xiamenensis]EKE81492.1 hypothetical protein A10D4_10456 [Idiomarina xiamenensis 10-D-4]
MNRLLYIVIAVFALGIGFGVYQLIPKPEPKALVYQPPRPLATFELDGTQATTVNNQSLQGQWTLLFTGYTYCPDICPTTMAQLRDILPQLQQSVNEPVKVWMVSVDPKRDSVARLRDYTGFFGDAFAGVRAEHKRLYPFVQDLGLMYSIPEEGDENYLVNHSAAIILVNPDGNRQAIFNAKHEQGKVPTVDMQQLADDFSIISADY